MFNIVANVFGGMVTGVLNVAGVLLKSIGSIIGNVIGVFTGLIKFIKSVFTGDWKGAWEAVKSIFSNVMSGLGKVLKTPLNAIISMINAVLGGLNRINIKIPDWVPKFGGKNFGVNIPKIPMLASGGYLYGGAAIVGEAGAELLTQQGGRTRVTPLNGSSQSGDIIDYAKLTKAFVAALANMVLVVDEDGVARMVDKRLVEVMA